jgi:hypothetical protein
MLLARQVRHGPGLVRFVLLSAAAPCDGRSVLVGLFVRELMSLSVDRLYLNSRFMPAVRPVRRARCAAIGVAAARFVT